MPEPFNLYAAPGINNAPALPAAIFLRHGKDITLQDMRIVWGDALGHVWQDAIQIEQVEELFRYNVSAPSPPKAND